MSNATNLDQRLSEVEAILRDSKGGESHAIALQQLLTRLASLEGALREQRHAFAALTTAQAIQRDTLSVRGAPYVQDIDSAAALQHSKAPEVAATVVCRADATTQTPPARAPTEPIPRPPPVRTSFPKPPRAPSPLQRTFSAENPSQGPDGSTPRHGVNGSPGLVSSPIPPSPQPAAVVQEPDQKIKQADPRGEGALLAVSPGRQTTVEGSTLRERRAAFAALQQPAAAQRTKARSRASLAIEASRREVERAARRAAREANVDRDGESGALSWLAFVILIMLGIGALFSGVMMMVARESWERARAPLGPVYAG